MLGRRSLVVSLADAQPGPATLVAARLLPFARQRGLRPVLVLGDLGTWRPRLEGHGPVISADRPDDYAAARFVRWTRAPRGLRPLRWLRARWWRLRLHRAGIVALSWPVPDIAARVLPPRLRARAEAPALPSVLPPAAAPGPAGMVAGAGAPDGAAGADLWIRVVHELHGRGRRGPFVWFGIGPDDDLRPLAHDRWHLGLEEVVELRPAARDDGTACEVLAAPVLLLAARPLADGPARAAARLPGFERWVDPGGPRAVGFVGVEGGAGSAAAGVEVEYPDVRAAADAVEAALDAGPADLDLELERLLDGAWGR